VTNTLAVLFVIFFVGGPFSFRMLTKPLATARRLRGIVILTACFASAGLFVRFCLPGLWGQDPWATAVGVLFIWCGWIGVLAFVALSLRRKDPSLRMRRWTALAGALCTTVPWFGLASANLLQG
jgi:hypothetical protein